MFRILSIVVILALVTCNVLTLTWGAFNATLSTAVASVSGLETVMEKRTKAVKKYGKRIVRRTATTTARSIASVPLESIPYVGVASILTITALEVKAACDNVKDVDELYSSMNIEDSTSPDALSKICNPTMPSIDTIFNKLPEKSNITDVNSEDQAGVLEKVSNWARKSWNKDSDETALTEEENLTYLDQTQSHIQTARLWIKSKFE